MNRSRIFESGERGGFTELQTSQEEWSGGGEEELRGQEEQEGSNKRKGTTVFGSAVVGGREEEGKMTLAAQITNDQITNDCSILKIPRSSESQLCPGPVARERCLSIAGKKPRRTGRSLKEKK